MGGDRSCSKGRGFLWSWQGENPVHMACWMSMDSFPLLRLARCVAHVFSRMFSSRSHLVVGRSTSSSALTPISSQPATPNSTGAWCGQLPCQKGHCGSSFRWDAPEFTLKAATFRFTRRDLCRFGISISLVRTMLLVRHS